MPKSKAHVRPAPAPEPVPVPVEKEFIVDLGGFAYVRAASLEDAIKKLVDMPLHEVAKLPGLCVWHAGTTPREVCKHYRLADRCFECNREEV